jgi:hypothetical protein
MVRTKKKLIVLFLVAGFIMPLLSQGIVSASADTLSAPTDGWRTIKTDVITVLFPAGGRKPMFLWWYNKDPNNVYVVKFDGLTEYFTFNTTYYKHQFEASEATFRKLFEELIERGDDKEHSKALFQRMKPLVELRRSLEKLREVVKDISNAWGHPQYLPFSGSQWTLQNVKNITADDNKIIGITFTFNLTRALPRFKFAENNVAIRVRFYYVPVKESVDNLYNYTVGANEMKMDFIVKDWKWNLDLVQPLLERLESYGIKVPLTQTGLALGIDLASINKTSPESDIDSDELGTLATTRRMLIEDRAVRLLKNKSDDDETPIEIAKGLKEQFKLKFASDNQTLGGFFKFIASAMVKNSSGSFQVPVKAAYRAQGASLRLYLGYPHFNGTLIHDPSIGVETPETTSPSATTPSYQVTIGGTTVSAVSAQLVAPQLLSMQLVILLVVVATAITLAMLLARSRGRTVVLNSV